MELIQDGLLSANIDTIRSVFKTEYLSMQILGAFIYTSQNRTADADRLRECRKIMKSKHGFFSDFRGHLQLPLVVKMSMDADPEGYLEGLEETYRTLSQGYKLGHESRLMAALLLYDNAEAADRAQLCGRTRELYNLIRKNHPFLTDQSDMPFAALMAMRGSGEEAQLQDTEACYQILKSRFPLSKNASQTVSHILAISGVPSEEKSERFIRMYDAFKTNKLRLPDYYMSILAVLVNSDISVEEAVRQTKAHEAALKQMKGFHGLFGVGTQSRRMFAAATTAMNNIPENAAVEGAVMSTVLSIIISIEITIMMMIIINTTNSAAASST